MRPGLSAKLRLSAPCVGEGTAEINGVDNDEVADEELVVGVAGADELDIDAPDREARWALTWSWSAQ